VNTDDQSAITAADLVVDTLGPATYDSPIAPLLQTRARSVNYVHDSDRVLLDDTVAMAAQRGVEVADLPAFEPGGPRLKCFFDGAETVVGIVTCGGLCPGLNNVIRGLVLELTDHYGVAEIVGFTGGYRGLTGAGAEESVALTPDAVRDIQNRGGTILGTTRGNQDIDEMVDTLARRRIDILFVVGGDGILRGAQRIADVAARRSMALAVVGIPKTIDNDIPYIDHSFGFQTAFARAAESIRAAATEAQSTPHAAMSGRTSMLVGRWHGRFVHVPIPVATRGRNEIDPDGDL
jgi:6-phosphofructokinase 1